MDSNPESSPPRADRRLSLGPYANYLRLLKLSRLLWVAFLTMVAFFVFWAIPWLPGGLSTEDYSGRVAFTLILVSAIFGSGVGLLALREWLRRMEGALVAFNAVYDATTGLYNRRYFYDRLTLECERAEREATSFSVLLFRFDTQPVTHRRDDSKKILRLLGGRLVRETRTSDVVAVLGGNELAVATVGVGKGLALELAGRLQSVIESVLVDGFSAKARSAHESDDGSQPSRLVRVGVSEYPSDGSNAAALLRRALESMDEAETDKIESPANHTEEAA